MAEWNREKVNSSDLNNGNEYDKDSQVALQELNGMVNAGLYAQDFAEHLADTPDISEINGTGTASVSFVDNPSATTNKPYKRFKFSNLKGSKGDKGDKGDTGAGSNPNLLINGDFSINQRGQSSYSEFANKYCVDRWRTSGSGVTVTPMDYGCSVSVGGTGQYYPILEQIIEDYASLIGKPVTLSANIKSVSVNLQPYQYAIRIRCYDTNNQIISTGESWIIDAGNYSCTITVPSNTVKVSCLLYKNAVVDCTFGIEYMKLEIGSVATPYSPRPYAEELALCQRYYQIRSNSYTIQPNAIDRPIPMRVDGTIGTITINETTYNYVDAEIYQ